MKKIFPLIIGLVLTTLVSGQSPASFKYQAVLRDSKGNIKANTTATIIISILQGSSTGTVVYSETHNATTDSFGLINLEIGKGTINSGTFSGVTWSSGTFFIKVTVDGVEMGTTQLLSVPYALYATKAGNGFSGSYIDLTNKPALFDGAYSSLTGKPTFATVATTGSYSDLTNKPVLDTVSHITVKGKTTNMEEALFEVKNKNGQTVFAVYNEGVRMYVDDGAKGSKGGFAIGGFGTSKTPSQNYFVVSSDSIRAYIDESTSKSTKGGFAVGGFSPTKNSTNEFLRITPDSTRISYTEPTVKGSKGGFAIGELSPTKGGIQDLLTMNMENIRMYIDDSGTKGSKGGFAIGGFDNSKGFTQEFLRITRDSSRIYFNDAPSKGSKGGFAIGGFNSSKGGITNYLLINQDSSNFYVRSEGSKGSSSTSFNILSYNPTQGWSSLMNANPDTISMSGVLSVENDFAVSGNIAYSGTVAHDTIPEVTTYEVTGITETSATSGGEIVSNGGAAVIVSGVCWSTSSNPTISGSHTKDGQSTGNFTSSITGLTSNTTYHVRAYATNKKGTAYGSELSFTTTASGGSTVQDIDGNVYNTVTIGSQTWTVENLKTTKFSDGSAIPVVINGTTWAGLSTPGFCWYNNDDVTYKATYGALYNWYALDASSNGGKNVCPTGWHVPFDPEWTVLTDYLGGETNAGSKLKEIGITHWLSPNSDATNETGFTALPGGVRNYLGPFMQQGNVGNYWSLTESSAPNAFFRNMNNNNGFVEKVDNFKKFGMSVRCLQGVAQPQVPTLITAPASAITETTAISGGNIVNTGGSAVTERGVCYSTSPNPTVANSKTSDGTGTGIFSSNLAGLDPNTTYYIRAYATNNAGTAYGNGQTFTTNPVVK